MQIRSLSLLLMIVSIAIAVLPVWRSPMISSRWPRPIGIIPSIAIRPVCTGSSTGWRSTPPGAFDSARGGPRRGISPRVAGGRPERVAKAPEQLGADGDLKEGAGPFAGVALADLVPLA